MQVLGRDYPELAFREVGFRSLFDMGTSKPESDFNNFHCNQDLYFQKIFRFIRPDQRSSEMYLFGSGMVKRLFTSGNIDDDYKTNRLGDNLADYSAAIFDNAESISRLQSLELSNDFRYLPRVNFDERYFSRDRVPDNTDINVLKEEWNLVLLDRTITKQLYQALSNQEQKK
ncbi:MAG: hypothetical protein EBS06_09150 [Proteobacteria bacterium]|nr:hypothetical protein [Pseudomonadota bacterium]